ncbi:hypothetical protein DPEC_G00012970 [Dallia pectoralis]|uniref:Uncharacterized protein n=1 Tax=Dallia pectoralis TaxID=75939 RepID=A0ACC2HMV5_DALPE|nr:hypothetical protein DPEC_G00012970 [Dallia pectoralis]
MGRQFICLGHAREKFEKITVQDVQRILHKKCNNECFRQVKAEKMPGSTAVFDGAYYAPVPGPCQGSVIHRQEDVRRGTWNTARSLHHSR